MDCEHGNIDPWDTTTGRTFILHNIKMHIQTKQYTHVICDYSCIYHCVEDDKISKGRININILDAWRHSLTRMALPSKVYCVPSGVHSP